MEIWKDIPGYENLYQVSDMGRVKSLDRIITDKNGRKSRRKGQILSPSIDPVSGYKRVQIVGNTRLVHRLVYEAFIGEIPKHLEVRHGVNGGKDNRLVNLSLGTHSDNEYDKRRDGSHWQMQKTHCPLNHPLVKPNLVPNHRGRKCYCCEKARLRLSSIKKRKGIDFTIENKKELADKIYQEMITER